MAAILALLMGVSACGDDGGDSDTGAGPGSDAGVGSDTGDAGGDDGSGGDGGMPDGGAPSLAVVGSAVDVYTSDSGEVMLPHDLSETAIEALVVDSDGSFTSYPAVGAADGSFALAEVPEGATYYLHLSGDRERYIVTDARELDIGQRLVGRSDQQAATVSPTDLVFDVDGMSPWQEGDILELYSPGAGAAFSAVESRTDIAEDSTALTMAVDYTAGAELPMLIDSSLGDQAFLIHLRGEQSIEGIPYRGLAEICYADPFVQVDGESAVFRGSFAPIAERRQRTVDWRASQFAQLAADGVPEMPFAYFNDVLGYVEVDPLGMYSSPLLYAITAPDPNSDVLATVEYGNPFPDEWGDYQWVRMYAYQLHELKEGFVFTVGGVSERGPLAGTGPIVPTLGPARDLRLDGQDAKIELSEVGQTPELSWEPPVLGMPDSYAVRIYRYEPSGGSVMRRINAATIVTTDTRVRVPPGVLTSGVPHYVRVSAVRHPGVPYLRQLFMNSVEYAFADTISTLFVP
ncbi:MAG: fibronectin type III domain-containing protein [Myxococcota bacterium]